jgi:hypothetical protein
MSAFYDQASLVVVPSGYKSGKIYAQKPLTTDGQLTFTRASTATRVNASGLIETVASGVPRLDYLGSTCPKLLLEPQRTNLVFYSEQFNNSDWNKNNLTITANNLVSPDGSTNADTALETATNAFHDLLQFPSLTSGTTYTLSSFVKAAGRDYCYLFLSDGTTPAAVKFNLATGVVLGTATGSPVSSKIENYGNGWYRCSMVYTSGATATGTLAISATNSPALSLSGYAGDITKGIAVYGAQLEAGAYATSYVKTEAATVTRLADTASKTGISSLIGQTEGTLFTEFTYNGTAVTTFAERIIAVGDGTANNRIVLLKNPSLGTLYLFVSSGINQTSIAGTSIIGGTHKVAIAYKSGDYAVYFDGASVFTSNATGVPTLSAFFLGTNEGGTIEPLGGTVSQALLFKTRLTNAQLAELTTL